MAADIQTAIASGSGSILERILLLALFCALPFILRGLAALDEQAKK